MGWELLHQGGESRDVEGEILWENETPGHISAASVLGLTSHSYLWTWLGWISINSWSWKGARGNKVEKENQTYSFLLPFLS